MLNFVILSVITVAASSSARKILIIIAILLLSTLARYVSEDVSPTPSGASNLTQPVVSTGRVASDDVVASGDSKREASRNAVALPPEAYEVIQSIARGGPFTHEKDGTVFQNRESRLPKKRKGYYSEYTVRTPGSRDRGARRIVSGDGGELYYTDDHYQSFQRIDPP